MKTNCRQFSLINLLVMSAFFCSVALGGEIELNDDVNLKLSRIKSKSRQLEHKGADDYIKNGDKRDDMFDENNGECGAVDIGNIKEDRPSFGPKKVDVIIIGDVINTDNRC